MQEFEEFRFTHPTGKVKLENPGFDARFKLTHIALGQSGGVG